MLQCSNDVIAPIEVGRFVHESLPHGDFVLLEATGHCPHLSHPDATTAAIADFLRRPA